MSADTQPDIVAFNLSERQLMLSDETVITIDSWYDSHGQEVEPEVADYFVFQYPDVKWGFDFPADFVTRIPN